MSDSEDRSSPPAYTTRHEKSLGLLTTKFVELLQAAEGGILDLKKVGLYTFLSRIPSCLLSFLGSLMVASF